MLNLNLDTSLSSYRFFKLVPEMKTNFSFTQNKQIFSFFGTVYKTGLLNDCFGGVFDVNLIIKNSEELDYCLDFFHTIRNNWKLFFILNPISNYVLDKDYELSDGNKFYIKNTNNRLIFDTKFMKGFCCSSDDTIFVSPITEIYQNPDNEEQEVLLTATSFTKTYPKGTVFNEFICGRLSENSLTYEYIKKRDIVKVGFKFVELPIREYVS